MIEEYAEPVLRAQELKHSYGAIQAVRGIDLAVRPGELFGLVGPDGAGKSTTISCFAGLLAPSAGSVRVLGQNPLARGSTAREQVGLLPQQYSLYGDLSVHENLRFFARLFGLDKREFATRSERLLAITRLARFTERRADALSGGMYKKLALACALMHSPSVLLLDEPTNGVDPVSRRELWELIYELVADGMAVLLSTPYMDEAARCHRVALMHEGRIIAEGAPGVLVQQVEHEVYELSAHDRDALQAWLNQRTDVLASSPAGTRVRVVIAPESRARFEGELGQVGGSMQRKVPTFEDVFLTRIGERIASTHAAGVSS